MIYISSRCIKGKIVSEPVRILAEAGFRNIELSGGTKYYPEYESDLLRLQDKYELNYLVHNYFPPPTKSFVLNLASMNDDIREKSIQLCNQAIRLSIKLGGKRYGVHAGFLIDIKPVEAGRKIGHRKQSNQNEALNKFADAWKQIGDEADGALTLYVENNVFSSTNAKTYSDRNPFLLTDYEGYLKLNDHVDVNLLLDVAHLKVSTNSLGLGFVDELEKLLPLSEYIHLSENDGLHDQNKCFKMGSDTLKALKKYELKGKIFTLETYCNIDEVKNSYNIVREELSVA
jgi:sugar phosphate isomerase/epimerase